MNLNLSSILRITGLVLIIIGISMLPSAIVSVIYDSSDVYASIFVTAAVSIFLGFIFLKIFNRKHVNLMIRDGIFIVTLCWFLSAFFGAVPFIITGSIPDPVDAFFESASGFSTTGATILTDVESLPRGILFWRSFTHWMGGMGILIFAIALMPSLGISGQNIAAAETPGPSLDKVSPKMSDTARALYAMYLIFTLLETVLLMLGGMSLYDALIHSFGTVGTGGFSSYNAGINHFDSTYIKLIIISFMVISGVNFNMYFLLIRRNIKSVLEDSEFRFYFLILAVFSAFIFMVLILTGRYASVNKPAIDSTFQVVSILTTTGYTTVDYEAWPTVCQSALLFLMFIGGCSSSTSGGIKVVRILVVFKLIKHGFAMRLHPNVVDSVKLNGKNIPSDTVSSIANHMFLYIAMIFAGAFIISFENLDMLTCFSSVITCLGNVGPGFGDIGSSGNFSSMNSLSKILLSIYMIAGRLELYTLFIMFTPRFWNQNH